MPWSTAGVAAETVARIAALGWSLDLRETLRDVDEPADLDPMPLDRAKAAPLCTDDGT